MMRWLLCVALGLLLLKNTFAQTPPQTSALAISYINHALDIMQQNALCRRSVNWVDLRRKVLERASGSQSTEDTYEAIRYGLRELGDHHSFLQLASPALQAKDKEARERRKDAQATAGPNEPWPPSPYIDRRTPLGVLETIDGIRVARLVVPEFDQSDDGRMHVYAETLRAAVSKLATQKPDGWVVDLRGNLGGSMWPMLAGLGVLAGEGSLGSFVDSESNKDSWFVAADGSGVKTHDGKRQVMCWTPAGEKITWKSYPVVAVLFDHGTASSGEAVAISFAGRPNSRSFGRTTHGQSTANDGFQLEDGANLVLTTSVEADRTGRVYLDGLRPDVELPAEKQASTAGTADPTTQAAASWIKSLAKHP